MFDPEQSFLQRWDTRQNHDQLNGYLTAFAHLNSALVENYGQRDTAITEWPRFQI